MIDKGLIAKCGMNCGLCMAYKRKKNPCFGCNSDIVTRKSCQNCFFKKCINQTNYCSSCDKFPCYRLKKLDLRYRQNYQYSMIENLMIIKEKGIDYLLKEHQNKYANQDGSALICIHHKK